VEHGADARQDRTAEERGDVERQLRRHAHRDHHLLGERRHAEVVVQRLAVAAMPAPLPGQQRAAAFAAAPGSHGAARPDRHGPHVPQETNVSTTWSPGARPATSATLLTCPYTSLSAQRGDRLDVRVLVAGHVSGGGRRG
jgi:hypothetical protein